MSQQKTGVIVLDPSGNYMLAVRGRLSKKWGPPKGHIEDGETLLAGAVREFEEEVGWQLDPTQKMPYLIVDRTRLFITILPLNSKFYTQDPHEIAEIGWIDLNDPPLYDLTTI